MKDSDGNCADFIFFLIGWRIAWLAQSDSDKCVYLKRKFWGLLVVSEAKGTTENMIV